jgi:hypothetical protein
VSGAGVLGRGTGLGAEKKNLAAVALGRLGGLQGREIHRQRRIGDFL